MSDPESAAVGTSPVAVFDNFWGTTLGFAVSLGRRGVPLHLYGNGAGRWSRYCTRRAACPAVENTARFLPWLRERIRSGEITRVAPTTDLIAYYVSELRDEFAPEVQRTIAPLAEIETCLIKTRFSVACAQAGQAVPLTASPEGLEAALAVAEEIGYPLVMKPKSHLVVGSVERGRVVASADDLRGGFRPYAVTSGQEAIADRHPELRWPLLQRYVPTARQRVFSVSGFKDADGGIIVASLSYKREQWPPDTGVSTSQVSCADGRILAAGLRAVGSLISRGIFELELLESGTELLAIDLNPRAFGFLSLDMALGNDLPWLWFRSTLGALEPEQAHITQETMEARLAIPHYVGRCIGALLGRRSPEADATAAAPARVVSMLGSWHDPVPLLMSNLRLLRHPGGLVRPYVRAARRSRKEQPACLPA